jgi:hypothetical protein
MRVIARIVLVAIVLLLVQAPRAQAQAEEGAVLAAVQQLFDAMAARDEQIRVLHRAGKDGLDGVHCYPALDQPAEGPTCT